MNQSAADRQSTESRRSDATRQCRRWCRLLGGTLTLFMLLSATTVAQSKPPSTTDAAASQPAHNDPQLELARWWQSFGWGLLLLTIFAAAASAIIVFSRRYRKYLQSESREPTPSDDVWSMHKLEDWDDSDQHDDEDEDTGPPPNAG